MTITPNQFSMVTTQGDLDLQFQGSVATMQVSANQATALVAGQAVKLEDAAGSPPPVVALAANTDSSFGFVVRTLKDIEFDTLAAVEVAMAGSVMQMTTGAAIARGAKLEVVYTTNKVITNAGTNPVMGFALDKATGADELIRVYILTPSYGLAQTIADIAGLTAALAAKAGLADAVAFLSTVSVTGLLTAAGGLTLGTKKVAAAPTVTLAAGATNSIDATITMKDAAGAAITAIQDVEVFLSTSATGALISATSYSGALTASTGAVLTALTATKHIKAVTDANGVLVLNLVASAKPATEYFCVVVPATGQLIVSDASGASWGA